jgi:hypothetical protein
MVPDVVVPLKLLAIIALSIFISGCSRWDLPPVPQNTAYNLDGTTNEPPARSARRETIRRPVRMANASIETTGSIPTGVDERPEDQEDELLGQIMKLQANSPEWLALRKRIEQERIAKNKRELARITICRC